MKNISQHNKSLINKIQDIISTGNFNLLSGLSSMDGNSIDRAYALYKDFLRLQSDIELLKHDLRDDYKNNFILTKGQS